MPSNRISAAWRVTVGLVGLAMVSGTKATGGTTIREIETPFFSAQVSAQGLVGFTVRGEETPAVTYWAFRWLHRDAEGNDLWPGTSDPPLRHQFRQAADGGVELSQEFEDFAVEWTFQPAQDGRALRIGMVAVAQRGFRSAEMNAQMPQLGVADGVRLHWPDQDRQAMADLQRAQRVRPRADWVAFERTPPRASLLLVARPPGWHQGIVFNPPSYLTYQDWPKSVEPGDEFRMDYLLIPYRGPLESALERFLPSPPRPRIELPRGFAFWPADSLELVSMHAADHRNRFGTEQEAPLHLWLAQGETEPFQWVFTPASGRVFREVTLNFSELTREQGPERLPATTFTWWRVRYHNRSRPEVLEPVASFDTLPEGDYNYPLWVEVQIPAVAPPGEWQATVTLISQGQPLATRTLVLQVWDFQVPQETHLNTSLFGFWPNFLASHYGIPDRSDRMMRLLREGCESLAAHRICHGHDGIGPVPYRPTVEETLTPEGERDFLNWCEFWEEHGIPLSSIRVCGWPVDEEVKNLVRRFWGHYWPLFQQRGWDRQCYHLHPDEYSTLEQARATHEEAQLLWEKAPGLHLMSTAIGAGRAVHEAAVGATDIWGTTPRLWTDQRPFFEARLAAGERVWLYIHHQLHLSADGLAPRTFFWQLSRLGLDGCVLYGLNVWGDQTITWEPEGLVQTETYVGYPFGDGVLYWPGPDGLLESIRLKQIRDGIEDWECLRLLQGHLARAEKEPGNERWIRQARTALRLRDALIHDCLPAGEIFEHNRDPAVFREIRRALGDALAETGERP